MTHAYETRYYTSDTDDGYWEQMATDPESAVDQAVEERVEDYIDEYEGWDDGPLTDGKPLTVFRTYAINYDSMADPAAAVPDQVEMTITAADFAERVADALEDRRIDPRDQRDPYEEDRKADVRAMNRSTPDRWRQMYG